MPGPMSKGPSLPLSISAPEDARLQMDGRRRDPELFLGDAGAEAKGGGGDDGGRGAPVPMISVEALKLREKGALDDRAEAPGGGARASDRS